MILVDNPVEVDATCCRVMGLKPEKVAYLARAGNLEATKIQELGEEAESVRRPFSVLQEFQELAE